MRKEFIIGSLLILVLNVAAFFMDYPRVLWSMLFFGPLIILGVVDILQKKQTIRTNFPLLGRLRYILELVRPEVNQYFIESNTDGRPYNRLERSVVYQRSKGVNDTIPFGTQLDVYGTGYEWINHSIQAKDNHWNDMRIVIGGRSCLQPYNASILNISAMSYGSLSSRAILALNGGAKDGGFAHNTGEGGFSDHHRAPGGDIIWQIGTGYFGCRNPDGSFNRDKFAATAVLPQIKMIELKISQGAKPGHGGILPKEKLTEEICRIRHVEMGRDVVSPPGHSTFDSPIGMLEFIKELRDLSGGKPVGFKFCVGRRREFISICKAMIKTNILPDFIVVDGGEGGTGAAPIEFSNNIGTPTVEGLIMVHSLLRGFGIRDQIKIISTGRVTTGFSMIQKLALGADLMYSARSMMMALGCIQALRCNQNDCPTGVATQDPKFVNGLHVSSKRVRVACFHKETVSAVADMLGAMGLSHPDDLRPWHINRRISASEVKHYGNLYDFLDNGALLAEATTPDDLKRVMVHSSAESFLYKKPKSGIN